MSLAGDLPEAGFIPLYDIFPSYDILPLYDILYAGQGTSLVAQTVKRLSTMRETWVRSLGREDSLEKETQPIPVLLPRKSHRWRSLVQTTVRGVSKSRARLTDFTSLHAGQEATVRAGHGTTDWFKTGKGVRQGCILSPCLFNLYAEYIM